jgi:hypothetical protein
LLVAPGKHGASELVKGLEGRRVQVTGTRVYRGPHQMIELDGAAVAALDGSTRLAGVATPHDGAYVTLRGEIVDSKCFLGVMVPGAGTTHQDCASLCIRGGIPPALFVKDLSGESALLLLVDERGSPVNDRALKLAGTAVEIRGTVSRENDWLVLRSNPAQWKAGR